MTTATKLKFLETLNSAACELAQFLDGLNRRGLKELLSDTDLDALNAVEEAASRIGNMLITNGEYARSTRQNIATSLGPFRRGHEYVDNGAVLKHG